MRSVTLAVLLCLVATSPADEPQKNGVKLSEAIRQLSSDDVGKRNSAASLMILFGGTAAEATEPLTKLVTDKNPDVRRHAVVALGEIGPKAKSGADALHKAAREDGNPSVRVWAARSLARVDEKRVKDAVEDLAKFLDESKSAGDRITAIEGLGVIGSKDAVPALEKLKGAENKNEREAARKALLAVEAKGLFSIKLKREDDKVAVAIEDKTGVLTFTCPTGIGEAVVERKGGDWPEAVVVRLRLNGLEHLRVKAGRAVIGAEVKSYADPERVRLWVEDSQESPKDAKSKFFLDFRMVGGDGKLTDELPKNGHFEFRLPKALLADNPKSVSLSWIDFYRR